LHAEGTKKMLHEEGKLLIGRFRQTFYNFIFIFPELTFHDFSLAPHQYIHISAEILKKSIEL
jgi:hypothetical protein